MSTYVLCGNSNASRVALDPLFAMPKSMKAMKQVRRSPRLAKKAMKALINYIVFFTCLHFRQARDSQLSVCVSQSCCDPRRVCVSQSRRGLDAFAFHNHVTPCDALVFAFGLFRVFVFDDFAVCTIVVVVLSVCSGPSCFVILRCVRLFVFRAVPGCCVW